MGAGAGRRTEVRPCSRGSWVRGQRRFSAWELG